MKEMLDDAVEARTPQPSSLIPAHTPREAKIERVRVERPIPDPEVKESLGARAIPFIRHASSKPLVDVRASRWK